mgnify:CR=1 FL=1
MTQHEKNNETKIIKAACLILTIAIVILLVVN